MATSKEQIKYRLYREHKFLRASLSDLETKIAKANFNDSKQVADIKTQLENLLGIMEHHAKHEEDVIHPLLRKKGSHVIDQIEKDHTEYKTIFQQLKDNLAAMQKISDETELVNKGYQFYIQFRQFIATDLHHINEEETTIMPELQKFYSAEEIKKAVDFPVYMQMSAEDMSGMLSVLFPHMNLDDKEHFLRDLQEARPKEINEVWQSIAPSIDPQEQNVLIKKLKLEPVKTQKKSEESSSYTPYSITPMLDAIRKKPQFAVAAVVTAAAVGFGYYNSRSNL